MTVMHIPSGRVEGTGVAVAHQPKDARDRAWAGL